jgi:hypothetical protein
MVEKALPSLPSLVPRLVLLDIQIAASDYDTMGFWIREYYRENGIEELLYHRVCYTKPTPCTGYVDTN